MASNSSRTDSRVPMSLAEHAYTEIKGRILSLQLRPGLFLNQQTLSKLLDIGAMPVRQAVHRLSSEGLIEVIPRKGLVIRPDSLNDVLALIEARLAMEPNVAAMAAERATKEQIANLKKLLANSKRIVDQSQRNSSRTLDRAFHGVIAESAGNKILCDALRPLHERSDLIWHLRIMPADGLVTTQHEHHDIYAAIAERDASAARSAMEAHLKSLMKRVLDGSVSH